jgi:hypothetical protein
LASAACIAAVFALASAEQLPAFAPNSVMLQPPIVEAVAAAQIGTKKSKKTILFGVTPIKGLRHRLNPVVHRFH